MTGEYTRGFYLVVEHLVQPDDVRVALASAEQTDFPVRVDPARHDFHGVLLAACFVHAAATYRKAAVA